MSIVKQKIEKSLTVVLNFLAKKIQSVNIEKENSVFFYKDFYAEKCVFLDRNQSLDKYEPNLFFEKIVSNLNVTTSIIDLGYSNSIRFIQLLSAFEGKIYIIELSKYFGDLIFKTMIELDETSKSRLVLYNYDYKLNIQHETKIHLNDLILAGDQISLVRFSYNNFINQILKEEFNFFFINTPIIYLEKIYLESLKKFNLINLFNSLGYKYCIIHYLHTEYSFCLNDIKNESDFNLKIKLFQIKVESKVDFVVFTDKYKLELE